MILRPSYLHNGIFYTGKTSLYWISPQDVFQKLDLPQGSVQLSYEIAARCILLTPYVNTDVLKISIRKKCVSKYSASIAISHQGWRLYTFNDACLWNPGAVIYAKADLRKYTLHCIPCVPNSFVAHIMYHTPSPVMRITSWLTDICVYLASHILDIISCIFLLFQNLESILLWLNFATIWWSWTMVWLLVAGSCLC